jgi:hypothetical protein
VAPRRASQARQSHTSGVASNPSNRPVTERFPSHSRQRSSRRCPLPALATLNVKTRIPPPPVIGALQRDEFVGDLASLPEAGRGCSGTRMTMTSSRRTSIIVPVAADVSVRGSGNWIT